MRTWEDFVEDLASEGKSLKHILAVAQATRWKDCKAEIIKHYKQLRAFFRKT
jgi:hypothetical protein